jgi:hypothetical protein
MSAEAGKVIRGIAGIAALFPAFAGVGCGGAGSLEPQDAGGGNTGMVGSGSPGSGDAAAFLDASAQGGADGGGAHPTGDGGAAGDGGGTGPPRGGDGGATGPDGSSPGDGGSIGVGFDEPPGFFSSLVWTVTGPNTYSGSVDFGPAQSVEFVVGGIDQGDGYALTLSGIDVYGDPCAGTSAPFAVTPGIVVAIGMTVTCTRSGDGGPANVTTGSVSVDAGVALVTGK